MQIAAMTNLARITRTAKDFAIAKCGGSRKVAPLLGITRQAVEQWERVPAEYCLQLEAISGVSRYELRPDVYGPAPEAHQVPTPFAMSSPLAAAGA